ncbi:unnamed protein product [Rhizophagus irregularis]|nr:unnamed protein product [Rhizophagus irregularis]
MFYLFGKTLWAVLYAIAMSVLFVVLPQPRYQGPSKIIELSDQDLYDIKHNKFHKLEETLKVKKVKANSKSFYEIYNIECLFCRKSRLPALILLKNGKENGRLPKRGKDNEQLEQIKNQRLRNVKETWDRLGWDRSMKSIIETFKLDTLNKTE